MSVLRTLSIVAAFAVALPPATALADLYINNGRSLTGGPTMVRDPQRPIPAGCRRVNEDTVACEDGKSTYFEQFGSFRFLAVHDPNKYCVVYVAEDARSIAPGRWKVSVKNEPGGPHCVLDWHNDNTVTIRAK